MKFNCWIYWLICTSIIREIFGIINYSIIYDMDPSNQMIWWLSYLINKFKNSNFFPYALQAFAARSTFTFLHFLFVLLSSHLFFLSRPCEDVHPLFLQVEWWKTYLISLSYRLHFWLWDEIREKKTVRMRCLNF